MGIGELPAEGRLKAALALIAALALVAGLAATSAQAGGGSATAAKKCKKKHSAVTAKKCKKAHASLPSAPAAPAFPISKPPAAPTTEYRADLTWTTAADLDLEVYYSATEYAYQDMAGTVNDIPNGTLSADSQTNGSEDFLDRQPPFDRPFAYAVCYSGPDVGPVDFTLDTEDGDGTVFNNAGTVDQDAGDATYTRNKLYVEQGAYDPAAIAC